MKIGLVFVYRQRYEDFITKIEEKLGSEFILKPFNKWFTVFLRVPFYFIFKHL